MKILITISYYTPNISGLTIYAENLAGELKKRGYKVEVLTSRHKKDLRKEENSDGMTINRIWTPFLFGRGPIMPTYLFESFFSVLKADVVNCHIPQFEAVFVCLWARLLGKKIIITHHCDLSGWKGFVNQITEKATYASLFASGFLADKIVVYTSDYADSSKYLSFFRHKLVYILPPVKVEKTKRKMLERYKSVKYKIGFSGRITQEKGIKYLLKAIPYIEEKIGGNFAVFLAGPFKQVIGGGFKRKLDMIASKYKGKVYFLGSVKPDEISAFYETLDVLVLPSTEELESFGFVQVEAMLSGCPVVASNIPGVRMPVRLSGMGCISEPEDSKDLAEKIVKVIKNKKKYKKSAKEIEKIFNYKKTIDKYEKLYKSIS